MTERGQPPARVQALLVQVLDPIFEWHEPWLEGCHSAHVEGGVLRLPHHYAVHGGLEPCQVQDEVGLAEPCHLPTGEFQVVWFGTHLL